MWNLPRPGLEPVSPALAGRFSTTAPPGKPRLQYFWTAISDFLEEKQEGLAELGNAGQNGTKELIAMKNKLPTTTSNTHTHTHTHTHTLTRHETQLASQTSFLHFTETNYPYLMRTISNTLLPKPPPKKNPQKNQEIWPVYYGKMVHYPHLKLFGVWKFRKMMQCVTCV